jgi:hypothetical protein
MPRQSPVIYDQIPADDRFTLPKHFCGRLSWIAEKNVEAWLYVLEPGRYRLLSDLEVEGDPQLEPLRTLVLQDQNMAPGKASATHSPQRGASIARLIPVTVENHKGSWRMPWPEEAAALCPDNCNPRTLAFLMPHGYLEIWYADFLRKCLQSQR